LGYLSIIVIIGAAEAAAEDALMASTPNLRPRFLVFHFEGIAKAVSTVAGTTVTALGSMAEIGGFAIGISLTISRSLGTRNAF
jgi:hypothetical protein